jgi:hypothetical protein
VWLWIDRNSTRPAVVSIVEARLFPHLTRSEWGWSPAVRALVLSQPPTQLRQRASLRWVSVAGFADTIEQTGPVHLSGVCLNETPDSIRGANGENSRMYCLQSFPVDVSVDSKSGRMPLTGWRRERWERTLGLVDVERGSRVADRDGQVHHELAPCQYSGFLFCF